MIIPALAVYILSPKENNKILAIQPLQKKSWKNSISTKWGKEFYNSLYGFLNGVQKERCCYCGLTLGEAGGGEIDHVAPTYKNPEYSFEAQNLVLSCELCNGPKNKHTWRTVLKKGTQYHLNKFKIVHPYLDIHQDHIGYLANHQMILITSESRKGLLTIRRLGLDSVERTNGRFFALDRRRTTLTGAEKNLYDAAIEFRKNP